jgi:hypothetical protein
MKIAEVVAMANQVTDITKTPDFQRWFKGSKVVDSSGRPLRVYHGTSQHFDTFDHENGPSRGGILAFFSTSPEFASDYAAPRGHFTPGAHVMPCYLRIIKPFDFRKEAWLANEFWEETGGIQDRYERNRILMGLGYDVSLESRDTTLTQEQFAQVVKEGGWDALEADEFVEWLRAYGHDGIVTLENNAVNYAIFDQNQVKSAFAQSFSNKPGISEAKKFPSGQTIHVFLPDLGADGVMVLRWANDPKWVEIRGENVWGDYHPENPLQHVLDRLLAPHVAFLMAGQEINIHPGHPDYEFAKSLLHG